MIYFMCSSSRVQYENIHFVTLEDCIITGIAIEHWGVFKEIPLQKPYLLNVPFTLVKRQKFTKRQDFKHTRKWTMYIILVQLQEMIFAVDFLHTFYYFAVYIEIDLWIRCINRCLHILLSNIYDPPKLY